MRLLIIVAILAALGVHVAFSRRGRKLNLTQKTVKESCQSGDGSSYRGDISRSASGRRCLNWEKFLNPWGYSKGVGNHNYCRNPDRSSMPWCRVRKGKKNVKEFCDIPRCPTSGSTVKFPPAVDTELTCGERSEQRGQKIVGGSFTPVESQPWTAAIFEQGKGFLCGGSLISPCMVVSAAHCFSDGNKTGVRHLSVYLGKVAINETDADKEQRFTVDKLIMHPDYNNDNFDNDIALLRIRSRDGGCAVKSAASRVVCLPPPYTQLPAGFQCSIAGYGLEHNTGRYSQYLKQTEVRLISHAECKSVAYYGDLITKSMLCAGSPDWNTDSCKGDSGGPLVCEVSGRIFLFGVVSWGEGCAKRNKPGVYTQVTNYNKWIAAKTGLSMYTKGLMYPTK